ncbi:hypothetical protein GW7_19101, partial [Heterocephalus glaber]
FFIFYFETRSRQVSQAGLELSIFLPQPPKCWDHRCALSRPAQFHLVLESFLSPCLGHPACGIARAGWAAHTWSGKGCACTLYPPASASQSAGIIGVPHPAQ